MANLSSGDYLQTLMHGNMEQRALGLAFRYGGIDGAHHKDWVIDQMVRLLAGSGYDEFVKHATGGEDGPETYEWSEGIAP